MVARAVVGAALVAALVWVGVALADSGPPAPTISGFPANPTNQTSASFTYTDSQAVTRFECQLDGSGFSACGTARPSSRSYSSLAAGSHTFQVRAVSGSKTSSTTSYTWVVDLTAPAVVSANTASANPTNAASVSWTVTFSEDVTGVTASNFQLVAAGGLSGASISSVAGGAPTSSWTVTAGTGSGSGTLQLKLANGTGVKDRAGNALGAPIPFSGQTYTIDKAAPTVSSINRADSSPTNAGSVHWAVTFSETVTGVGSGNFSLVSTGLSGSPAVTGVSGSGASYTVTASTGSGTPSGSGTLQLKLSSAGSIKDSVGNGLTGAPFSGQTYTIDKTPPPAPSITSKPVTPTNQTSAHLVFSDSEAGVTFLCKLDGGSFAACASPQDYPGPLAQGSHTFQVEAKDAAGNVSSAASWTWTVDTTPPNAPTIQSAPFAWPPIGWSSTNAIFAFNDSSSDVASYQCKLDAGSFALCISPQGHSGLAQGQHTFQVRAVDQAGNVGSATSWTFFVDTIPPNKPTLTGAPANPTSSQTATFSWTDSDPGYPATGTGIAAYTCKLDNGNWELCSSPKTYNNLSLSQHTFQVVAIDWAGNASQTASYTWTVQQNQVGQPFTIGVADATGLLSPGGHDVSLNLVFTNPNSSPITVNSLNIAVTGTNTAACPLSLAAVTVSQGFTGPAGPFPGGNQPRSLSDLGVPQSQWPRLHMADNGNQDACKGIQVNLSFTNGQATG